MIDRQSTRGVPVACLEGFCQGESDRRLDVYDIPTADFSPGADLNEHSSPNPLFSEDGRLHRLLRGPSEGWEEVTENILKRRDTPPTKSGPHHNLVSLVLELACRTKLASSGANDIIAATVEWLTSRLPFDPEVPRPDSNAAPDGPAWALARAYALVPQLLDLEALFIRNKHRHKHFIASDNPVLFYNQLLESGGVPFSRTAPAALGLQIFVPLTPEACLLFYDGTSYDTARSAKKARVRAKTIDVDHLNALQYTAAHRRLYLPPEVGEKYVREMTSALEDRREPEERCVQEFTDLAEEGSEYPLLLFGRDDTRCGLDLSFISPDEDALPEDPATRPLEVRDRRWHHVCRMYRAQIPVLAQRGADHLGFRHWFDDIRANEAKHELANQYLELIDGQMYSPEQWPEWLEQVEQHEDFTWTLP